MPQAISELVINAFDEELFDKVKTWLGGMGCTFEKVDEGYKIGFPPGTIEYAPAGRSTQWTYVTEISVPGKGILTKYRAENVRTGELAIYITVPKSL